MKTILLIEDSPGDARLVQEVFNGAADIHHFGDGQEAIDFLEQRGRHTISPRPDLIILDLNLPKLHGHEVLARIKQNDNLKAIPTVILSSSVLEADTVRSYRLGANCQVRKPGDWDGFEGLVRGVYDFWLRKATLPNQEAS